MGKLKDNTKFRTYTANYPDLINELREKDVKITVRPIDDNKWYAFLLNWGPMLILLGIWIFLCGRCRQAAIRRYHLGKAAQSSLMQRKKDNLC